MIRVGLPWDYVVGAGIYVQHVSGSEKVLGDKMKCKTGSGLDHFPWIFSGLWRVTGLGVTELKAVRLEGEIGDGKLIFGFLFCFFSFLGYHILMYKIILIHHNNIIVYGL